VHRDDTTGERAANRRYTETGAAGHAERLAQELELPG
jgi:hypothetical protein